MQDDKSTNASVALVKEYRVFLQGKEEVYIAACQAKIEKQDSGSIYLFFLGKDGHEVIAFFINPLGYTETC